MLYWIYNIYADAFKGFRKEVWWLSLVTLINRAGTMVVPFMSLYLRDDLGFSLKNVGWIMSAFGVGSFCGAWLGGKLTDRWGFYPVIFWSLTLSGLMFIGIQYIHSFIGFSIGICLLMIVADTYRPAAYVAITTYSKPENRTRSVTLMRLAINLGFSMGPAAGGMIIALLNYRGLFWIDGLTCIAAAAIFIYKLDSRQARKDAINNRKKINLSPYKDLPYLLFVFLVFMIGFVFLQLFSTLPLFYKDVHKLSESQIGFLMAMNGLLIFIFEMPLIKYCEKERFSLYRILILSTTMIASSFAVLVVTEWTGILIISILLITFGEMLNFPFLNRFALDRSERGKSGDYMALFTMSFSFAHIVGHNFGMQLIDRLDYTITWLIQSGIVLLVVLGLLWLKKIVEREKRIGA